MLELASVSRMKVLNLSHKRLHGLFSLDPSISLTLLLKSH